MTDLSYSTDGSTPGPSSDFDEEASIAATTRLYEIATNGLQPIKMVQQICNEGGTTCWLNSILQAICHIDNDTLRDFIEAHSSSKCNRFPVAHQGTLFSTPSRRAKLKTKKYDLLRETACVPCKLKSLQRGNRLAIRPRAIVEHDLFKVAFFRHAGLEEADFDQEQDVIEMLASLLTTMKTDGRGVDVDSLFKTVIRVTTTCQRCGTAKHRLEDLAMPIPSRKYDYPFVSTQLQAFCERTPLDTAKCSDTDCPGKQFETKRICDTPEVLFLPMPSDITRIAHDVHGPDHSKPKIKPDLWLQFDELLPHHMRVDPARDRGAYRYKLAGVIYYVDRMASVLSGGHYVVSMNTQHAVGSWPSDVPAGVEKHMSEEEHARWLGQEKDKVDNGRESVLRPNQRGWWNVNDDASHNRSSLRGILTSQPGFEDIPDDASIRPHVFIYKRAPPPKRPEPEADELADVAAAAGAETAAAEK